MGTEVKVKTGTPIVFAASAEFGNVPYDDTIEMDIGGLANAGAWQSAKADLGETRAAQYAVRIGIELDVDLSAAGTVEVYWSSSPSGTAATGNTGGASGANEAYTAGVNSQLENLQLIGILALPATCDDDICYQAQIGVFTPPERYGSIVLVNKSGQALEATADTMYVALIPIVDEIQNA
jgi:hypothetical protein